MGRSRASGSMMTPQVKPPTAMLAIHHECWSESWLWIPHPERFPATAPSETTEVGLHACASALASQIQMKLLISSWSSPGCCGHLESELAFEAPSVSPASVTFFFLRMKKVLLFYRRMCKLEKNVPEGVKLGAESQIIYRDIFQILSLSVGYWMGKGP